MAEDGTFTVCPYCNQRVEPGDPGVTYGREQVKIASMTGSEYIDGMGGFLHPGEYFDGMGGFFHPSCPMGPVGYEPRPLPEPA